MQAAKYSLFAQPFRAKIKKLFRKLWPHAYKGWGGIIMESTETRKKRLMARFGYEEDIDRVGHTTWP